MSEVRALFRDTKPSQTDDAARVSAKLKSRDTGLPQAANLQLITLHLARCREHPEGSRLHGYAFVAPLDAEGHLDAQAWQSQRERCYVRRFWNGETDRVGRLVHRRGGAGGATWCFAYADHDDGDTEAGHRLQTHRFVPGEYVSIHQDDDEARTFQIVDVRKACAR